MPNLVVTTLDDSSWTMLLALCTMHVSSRQVLKKWKLLDNEITDAANEVNLMATIVIL